MSDDIIKRLRDAIAAGPTQGPWTASNPMSDVHSISGPEHWQGVCRAYGQANCVYIAAASPDNIAALLDRLDAAERERDALAADARRYRWLRGREDGRYMTVYAFRTDIDEVCLGEELDAAIDAARREG